MAYATATDVVNGTLKGFDLTKIGADAAAQAAYITTYLLDQSTLILENSVGRDFTLHNDDVFEMDGADADQLQLWKTDYTLCVPVITINSIKVYGAALTLTDLKIDKPQGIVGYQKNANERLEIRRELRGRPWIFPRDFRNIEVNLDWGYVTPPADVKKAHELVIASMVLMVIAGAVSGGLRARRIDDFEEIYSSAGPFSQQIGGFAETATAILSKYRTGRRRY